MLFAYFSPEVVLPLASLLGSAVGFILMVGRAPFRFAARGARAVRAVLGGRKRASSSTGKP